MNGFECNKCGEHLDNRNTIELNNIKICYECYREKLEREWEYEREILDNN